MAQADIIEINRRLDINNSIIANKIGEITKYLETLKNTPKHVIRKNIDRLQRVYDDINKKNLESLSDLNELNIKVNETISVIKENIRITHEGIIPSLDETKLKIQKSQKHNQPTSTKTKKNRK